MVTALRAQDFSTRVDCPFYENELILAREELKEISDPNKLFEVFAKHVNKILDSNTFRFVKKVANDERVYNILNDKEDKRWLESMLEDIMDRMMACEELSQEFINSPPSRWSPSDIVDPVFFTPPPSSHDNTAIFIPFDLPPLDGPVPFAPPPSSRMADAAVPFTPTYGSPCDWDNDPEPFNPPPTCRSPIDSPLCSKPATYVKSRMFEELGKIVLGEIFRNTISHPKHPAHRLHSVYWDLGHFYHLDHKHYV